MSGNGHAPSSSEPFRSGRPYHPVFARTDVERTPASITDFLTDASFVALCSALGQLTKAQVTVHEREGRRIVFTRADPPWMLAPADADSARVRDAMHQMGPGAGVIPQDGRLVEQLSVSGEVIGAVVIAPDHMRSQTGEVERLRQILSLLCSTVNELCENDVLLRQRNAELSVLFRLSSMLVAAPDLDAVLNAALRAAADVSGADAALVHLLDDDGVPVLRAHLGLSERFVRSASLSLNGGDELRRALAEEGLNASIAGNLNFNGQALGTLRVLHRSTAYLEPAEQALLQTIMEQVSAAVASERMIESQQRARAMERQLQLAADVQRRMLPRSLPRLARLDADARYIPSLELSGDFYDLIDLNENLAIIIGDVAGKGVPAALMMAAVRASLRAFADDHYHLDQIMARANKAMVRDTQTNEFATVFYGVIDPTTLRLTYCNAGHDPPLLLRPPEGRAIEDRDLYELDVGGMAIGIDPDQAYERGMFDLEPGDVLIAYTDGVVDARTFSGQKFGRARLRAAIISYLTTHPRATANAIADHVVWEVRRFIGLNPPIDDQTLVALRVTR